MLGKRQKQNLERAAKWATKETTHLVIVIKPYRPYTREFGKGYPVNLDMMHHDVNPPERENGFSISLCGTRTAAFEKSREVARYLSDELKVSRAKVTIQSYIGKDHVQKDN